MFGHKVLATILQKKDVLGRMRLGRKAYGSLGGADVVSGAVSDDAAGVGVDVVSDSAEGATVVVSSFDEDDDSW